MSNKCKKFKKCRCEFKNLMNKIMNLCNQMKHYFHPIHMFRNIGQLKDSHSAKILGGIVQNQS